ncbi:MAG: biosynthetic-type acetolactate synthase large subunit [Candidatus Bathyarchaeota archaeon]|nr:biosynthetic-type acetolactate synthase large subunit [Candidatus Bathyarchaeota archaeon]
MTKTTGSRAYIKTLENEGVTHMFGITGAALIPICDDLLDSKIRYIPGVHEQGSAHMADGYARASGKPGVVQVTSGPGATNIVTGVATAQLDSAPLVAFTGQVPMNMVGTDAFQEVDIIGVTASITKWNYQVRDPARIPWAVKAGMYISNTGRKGAVVIDLPKNVTTEEAEFDYDVKVELEGYKPIIDPNPHELETAVKVLMAAQKPVIMAGGGVIAAGAGKELAQLAELLMAPVATSLMGKGAIPSNHPLSLGLCGMHGRHEANYMVPDADVLLVVGARFSDRTTANLSGFAPNAKIIHIDIDRSEIDKNVSSITKVIGDARYALSGLYKRLMVQNVKTNGWHKRITEVKQYCDTYEYGTDISTPNIIRSIRQALPNDAIVTTDVGQHQMFAALHYDVYEPGTFLTSGGLGTMGWGLPAAIGAKAAKPDRKVLAICGDGGFHMTENNLTVAVDEDLPIITVVLNNRLLGMVAQWQRLFMDGRLSTVDRDYTVDYTELSKTYGAHAVRTETLDEFNKAMREAVDADYTTVIEVPTDPNENVYPHIPPGMGLKDILTDD